MTDYRLIANEYVIYDVLGTEKARVPFKTKEDVISLFNNDLLSPKEKGIYGMIFSEKEFIYVFIQRQFFIQQPEIIRNATHYHVTKRDIIP
jgi:hypothetical protein